jgi:hypothetical protein
MDLSGFILLRLVEQGQGHGDSIKGLLLEEIHLKGPLKITNGKNWIVVTINYYKQQHVLSFSELLLHLLNFQSYDEFKTNYKTFVQV